MHPLKAAYRFTLHTVAGAAMFAVVGGAAVALNYCAILIANTGVSPYIVLATQSLEFFLFLADVICVVFFIRVCWEINESHACKNQSRNHWLRGQIGALISPRALTRETWTFIRQVLGKET